LVRKREVIINYPEVAKQNSDQLIKDPEVKGLYSEIVTRLRSIVDIPRRVAKAHELIDNLIDSFFEKNRVAQNSVSCTPGCTGCCHSQVSVSKDEARVLADLIRDKKIIIDHTLLEIQKTAQNDYDKWYMLKYSDRRCIFLGQDNLCSVYEKRPAVCRTNFVFSHPSLCHTKEGAPRPVRLVKNDFADLNMIASYEVSGGGGSLPSMVARELEKISLLDIPPSDLLAKS